ncbi:hypothetical protein PoB_007497000 [Plakobranchus ocellatus]|uniref:Uncharacterized protein n=1 Tax=Plakobranchus ocellatus TaxID=259542 RepID=A0AAV4DWP0_9GAST|nr:hypothetical protein PoB_007497000 [Plakobranchus ocellatus]
MSLPARPHPNCQRQTIFEERARNRIELMFVSPTQADEEKWRRKNLCPDPTQLCKHPAQRPRDLKPGRTDHHYRRSETQPDPTDEPLQLTDFLLNARPGLLQARPCICTKSAQMN